MATLEERMQAIEHEHAELKKTIELQTIAIGALANKATLEKLDEKYDKLFETLIAHDSFTNEQLAELRNQDTELDGKVVGLQIEMRQRFAEQDSKITALDGKVVGLQTEMRQRFEAAQTETHQRFTGIETALTQILGRLPEKP
jgi:hypothetical protein